MIYFQESNNKESERLSSYISNVNNLHLIFFTTLYRFINFIFTISQIFTIGFNKNCH